MAKVKLVHFGKGDNELLEYADKIENFSQWVKGKLRNEIKQQHIGIGPELEKMVAGMIETKLAGRIVVDKQQTLPPVEESKKEENIAEALDNFF